MFSIFVHLLLHALVRDAVELLPVCFGHAVADFSGYEADVCPEGLILFC